jgi:hypothetical protein
VKAKKIKKEGGKDEESSIFAGIDGICWRLGPGSGKGGGG